MQVGEFQSLLQHMEWADALVWQTVLGLPKAREDGLLIDRLYHVHTVQWVYLQAWRGDPLKVPERGTFSDLPAVAVWARPYYAELRSYAQGLTREALSREFTFPWAEEIAKRFGSAEPATLGETVLQVVLHSTHHRAQIATRIREIGGEPPLTDFVAWAWKGRPAAQWPG
jgi:uncharacterized damage-inducible protein DinB